MTNKPSSPTSRDAPNPAHEVVYRALRSRILYGQISPGAALTLRGVAKEFEVSMTPAREAVRRLAAEGALSLSSSGRISTPELTTDRIEELASLRGLIEPELAARALPRAHLALIERLQIIHSSVLEAIVKEDAVAYIRANLEFHRMLYLRAQAPAMLALAEQIWLQLGPTMRSLYGRLQRTQAPRNHLLILSALRAGDEPSLRLAVRADVSQGLKLLTA
jgi:DNA-binding GntR family transcriptional regulator